MPPLFKNRSIRVTIMAAFVGLLFLTAIPIIGYMHSRNAAALLQLADELMVRCSAAIMEKTTNYLEPAAVMAEMSAHLAETGSLSLTSPGEQEAHAIAVLKAYPQLAMFNMADAHGNFLMPKKMPDGSIATKIIRRDANPPTVTWKYRDLQGNVTRSETTTDVSYDPRVRPWYKGAAEAEGIYWTDMYILFTDQVPGITTAYPLRNGRGNTIGVFGLDMELGAISAFLRTLEMGSDGVAFVFNGKGEVVAYPDVSRIVIRKEGKLSTALCQQLGDARLTDCLAEHRKTRDSRFTFASQGVEYIGSVLDFPGAFGRDWKIGLIVAQDDFIGTLSDTSRNTLLIALSILLGSVLIAHRLARSISQPISALEEEARQIQNLQFEGGMALDSPIAEIQGLRNALASMKVGLSAFGRYVPSELVKQLVRTGEAARIGGHREELSIFFSDIAGFTPISEALSPETLMIHLSEYLEQMTQVISKHGGTVDKFIGDAVMAFWGAPTPEPDHAYLACLAALHCQQRVREMNAKWEGEGKKPFPTRIGIHTGDVVVGNVGSSERMNYSVFGDAVNVASRLEGASKAYGTSIIVGQATYEKTADRLIFRPLDRVAVLGRKQGIMIYELIGEAGGDLPPGATTLCEGFSAGLEAYFRRDWDEAIRHFDGLALVFPNDVPTALFQRRCRALLATPPDDDWGGVNQLKAK